MVTLEEAGHQSDPRRRDLSIRDAAVRMNGEQAVTRTPDGGVECGD
jgi:hypothetical protein